MGTDASVFNRFTAPPPERPRVSGRGLVIHAFLELGRLQQLAAAPPSAIKDSSLKH